MIHRSPKSLDRPQVQAGFEYIGNSQVGDVGTLVGRIDYKSFKEHDWDNNTSLKVGIELHHPDEINLYIRFMLEAYEGR